MSIFNADFYPAPAWEVEHAASIRRMCDIILGNTFGNEELDSLALLVGHHPDVLNASPAPAGEVAELVAWLRAWARGTLEEGQPATSRSITRAADLLEQRHPAPVPVPVAIADRLPTPSECDRGRCWWGRQVNSRRWSWTFSIDPQGDTHWLPATVERLPANIVPVLPEDAQVIEPTKHTILVPVPVPVAVSERPWEREGWCHPQERWAWFYNRRVGWRDAIPPESLKPPTLFPYTHSLPFNALPLPSGEVQP